MEHNIANVPYIYQREKYVNGCESVSAVMVLRYFGFDITADDFIDNYLDIGRSPIQDENGVRHGADPFRQYPGDPRDDTGWGCFPPVIMSAMSRIPGIERFELTMHRGISLDVLCRDYIDRDIPVIFWATIDMQPTHPDIEWLMSDGRVYRWLAPMHCLVLTGYRPGIYIFNDPWQKKGAEYSSAAVENAYREMGTFSLTIRPL
ncbi:MAG: C39 family peptidase [Eubacteriales bacterium]